MDIQTNYDGLKDIFSTRYRQNVGSSAPTFNNIDSEKISSYSSENFPSLEDVFLPTEEYSQIIQIKDEVKGGLKDLNSFVSMAQVLKNENIINNNDMIAVDFLAKESPKLSFDAFNKIIRNDNLSMEMKGLISQLVQKLEMIDYVSNGAMEA